MTREEAIKVIKNNWPDSRYSMLQEALTMAIEALNPWHKVSEELPEEKYIPSADYLNAAKKAFQKACGWLSVYPWYEGVYEEFVKELEDNL